MSNNYSYELINVFKDAENISISFKFGYVGTEHIILSMLKNCSSIKEIFGNYDISYNIFLDKLIDLVDVNVSDNTYYTVLLKRIINNINYRIKEREITVKDILIGILEEGEGIGIRVLLALDIDIDELYKNLINNNKPNLEVLKLGKDLNNECSDNVLIGRDKEINLCIETLLRRNKNNPLLIGEAGVGKTAIVEEIARRINLGLVPEKLRNKRIISLEMSSLVAGTKYRGEFEEKLGKIIKELEHNKDIILFIDEIHTISNAGGAEGAINASDILKPYLARGKIKIIGATTLNEYNKYIVKDKALERRFEIIKINEPTIDETINILTKIKYIYEDYYNLKISNDSIKYIVNLSNKYITNRYNPDKAIDLLDSACAMKKLNNEEYTKLNNINKKLNKLKLNKELLVKNNNFKEAINIRNEEIKLLKKIDNKCKKKSIINNKDIINSLKRIYNIPDIKLNGLKEYLNNNIIGQDNNIELIINTLENKPINKPVSMLLIGSSGVGKTMTVKKIVQYLKLPLIRLDMSEFNSSTSTSRLLGTSQGYVGYNDEIIFDKIKLNPVSIILLDEIEKANHKIINLFLTILDEGYITNNKGEKIDFSNTYIFMTSNAKKSNRIGFNKETGTLNNYFSKEFISRIDKLIEYNDITEEIIKLYLVKHNLKDIDISNYDYSLGLRGIDKYIKTCKSEVRGSENSQLNQESRKCLKSSLI